MANKPNTPQETAWLEYMHSAGYQDLTWDELISIRDSSPTTIVGIRWSAFCAGWVSRHIQDEPT